MRKGRRAPRETHAQARERERDGGGRVGGREGGRGRGREGERETPSLHCVREFHLMIVHQRFVCNHDQSFAHPVASQRVLLMCARSSTSKHARAAAGSGLSGAPMHIPLVHNPSRFCVCFSGRASPFAHVFNLRRRGADEGTQTGAIP